MKFELKNVKYADFQSQETHCFQATLYKDGKRLCQVSNEGHGGCDDYQPLGTMKSNELWPLIKEINAELRKEEIKFGDGLKVNNCLEIVVGNLMNEWLSQREVKRILKRIAYVNGKGQIFQFPAKLKPTQENIEKVQKTKTWKADYILLNTLPFQKAAEYINAIEE